jgi:hypothetical protein
VAIDLSAAYRTAVSTCLSEATIVFDERLSALRREATEVMHKEMLEGTW